MNERVLFFSPERCSGCKRCEMACSLHNAKVCDPAKSFIHALIHPRLGTPSLVLDDGCQSCGACVVICNLNALKLSPEAEWGDLLKEGWIPVPVLLHTTSAI